MMMRQVAGITKHPGFYINQLVVSDLAQISQMAADPQNDTQGYFFLINQ